MTVREKLLEMLTSKGMFDNQAKAVLDIAIPRIEAATPEYKPNWDRPAEEYPQGVYNALWLYLKSAAKEWIAENVPNAWFRMAFD